MGNLTPPLSDRFSTALPSAKVFGAVGVALPPLLTLEPEDKRLEEKAAGEAG